MTDRVNGGLAAAASTLLPLGALAADRAAEAIEQLRVSQSRIDELESAKSECDRRWTRLQAENLRLSDEAERARRDALAATARCERLEATLDEMAASLATLRQEARAAREALTHTEAQKAAILSSRSWRLLSPVRWTAALVLGRR
jgi:chromosome segregation ATPase